MKRLLRIQRLEEIMDIGQLNAQHLVHNMTQVNKTGMVTNIKKPGTYFYRCPFLKTTSL
jgi:hypothetical protein